MAFSAGMKLPSFIQYRRFYGDFNIFPSKKLRQEYENICGLACQAVTFGDVDKPHLMRATAFLFFCLLFPLLMFAQLKEDSRHFDERGALRGDEPRRAEEIPMFSLLDYSSIHNPFYWKNHPPSQDYWQQDIHYAIAAKLAPERNLMLANMELMYHNNSDNILSVVYFQLPARYKGHQPPVQIRSVRHNGERVRSMVEGNWLKVFLDQPLRPDLHASLEVDFVTHFPLQSRPDAPGRDTIGRTQPAYRGWAWYPRIAPYSRKHAWQPEAPFGDFGTYDVRITLPGNYFIAATGELANEDEMLSPETKEEIALSRFMASADQHYHSPDSALSKTWVFQASNVNDFIFVADPLLRRKEIWMGDSLRVIDWIPEPLVGTLNKDAFFQQKLLARYMQKLGPLPMRQSQLLHGVPAPPNLPLPFLFAREDQTNDWMPASRELAYALFNHADTAYREGFAQFFAAHEMEKMVPDSQRTQATSLRWSKAYEPYMLSVFYDSLELAPSLKHAVMFHHLAGLCQEDEFYGGVRSYLNQWATLHPDPEDFEGAFHQYLESDLNGFFRSWRESIPSFDYRVEKVKKISQGKKIRLTLGHTGNPTIPLDFIIETDTGDILRYHIPRSAYAKDEPNQSVLLPWPGDNDTYETEITLPASFKRLILDPDRQTVDLNRLNNYKGYSTLRARISLLPPKPQNHWDHYQLTFRPNLWWNGQSGLQTGLSIHGHKRARDHQFHLAAWYNTAIGQTQPPGFPEPLIHPFSYRFAYATPLRKWGKGFNIQLKSAFQDGLQRHIAGIEKNVRQGHRLTRLSAAYHFQLRERFNWQFYLIENQDWNLQQNNATLRLAAQTQVEKPTHDGSWRAEARSSFLGSEADYAYLEGETKHRFSLFDKVSLRLRALARYGRGDTPLESQLYRSGGSPEERFEDPFYRARGFFPDALLNDYDPFEPHHVHFAGGLNLRGYSGWWAQQDFRAGSGAAANVELSFGEFLPKIHSRIDADIYLFYDGGILGESVADSWLPVWHDVQQDAGLGLSFDLFDGRFFTANKPLTLRLDMPVWLSQPPDGAENLAFRWVVGIGKMF